MSRLWRLKTRYEKGSPPLYIKITTGNQNRDRCSSPVHKVNPSRNQAMARWLDRVGRRKETFQGSQWRRRGGISMGVGADREGVNGVGGGRQCVPTKKLD